MDIEQLRAKRAELERQLVQTANEYNQVVAFVRGKIEALQEMLDELEKGEEADDRQMG